MDLIKCPDCGEEYSASYPRCPFCEEEDDGAKKVKYTPRRRIADKQKSQSARGGMIAVLVLVLALLSWYLFGDSIAGRGKGDGAQTFAPADAAAEPVAETDPFYDPGNTRAGDAAQGGAEVEPEPEPEPEPVIDENVDVSNAKLNREDFTLSGVGDSWTLKLSGTEATPRWSIDNGNVASVDSNGTVTAIANGKTTIHCKAGTRDLTCILYVRNTGKTAEPADAPTAAEPASAQTGTPAQTTTETPAQATAPETPAQTTAPAASGTAHVDASSLSVKTNYGTVLKRDPDEKLFDCTVRIGGDFTSLRIVGTDVPVSSWTSDKPSVVEISADGKLTPVSAGRAYVTATVGDATVKCIVRVRGS